MPKWQKYCPDIFPAMIVTSRIYKPVYINKVYNKSIGAALCGVAPICQLSDRRSIRVFR